jgi:hypothetical protein
MMPSTSTPAKVKRSEISSMDFPERSRWVESQLSEMFMKVEGV